MSCHQQKRERGSGFVPYPKSDSARDVDPYLRRGHFRTKSTLEETVRTRTRFDSSIRLRAPRRSGARHVAKAPLCSLDANGESVREKGKLSGFAKRKRVVPSGTIRRPGILGFMWIVSLVTSYKCLFFFSFLCFLWDSFFLLDRLGVCKLCAPSWILGVVQVNALAKLFFVRRWDCEVIKIIIK